MTVSTVTRTDARRKTADRRLCSVEGCDRPRFVRTYCKAHYQRVLITGNVGSPNVRGYVHWTHRRRVLLEDLLAWGWTDDRIADHMGTTAHAVKQARRRYGIAPRYRQGYTVMAVCRLLGVGQKAVERWIRDGRIEAFRNGARYAGNRVWQIRDYQLMDFLDNPDHWHCWEVEVIVDDRLRHYAEHVRGNVRYLTIGEVAYRAGVTYEAVWKSVNKGAIPSRRDGYRIYVAEHDARVWIDKRRSARNRTKAKGKFE